LGDRNAVAVPVVLDGLGGASVVDALRAARRRGGVDAPLGGDLRIDLDEGEVVAGLLAAVCLTTVPTSASVVVSTCMITTSPLLSEQWLAVPMYGCVRQSVPSEKMKFAVQP